MISASPGGVRVELRIQPGASSTGLAGTHAGRLKLRVQAPPLDGRANDAVIEWIAGTLGVPQRNVTLIRGATSRDKTVEIAGVTEEHVREVLRP
jgi:uncharacterized protein (TIGR00251 family)